MDTRAQTDNPATIRGDIARGRAGGKKPGFDPAAAPLETDSEAGGSTLTAEQVREARETQSRGVKDGEDRVGSTSYHDAMRRPRMERPARNPPPTRQDRVVMVARSVVLVGLFLMALAAVWLSI